MDNDTPDNVIQSTEENLIQPEAQNTQEISKADQLEVEKKELQDKYLRLVAEFDNYKKRNAKERIDLIQTAGKDILFSLLDVLDDSERATAQLEKETDITKIKEGTTLVFSKFKSILLQKGLKKMDSLNQPFNTETQEAITEIETAEDKKGLVVDVVQDGYFLNDKLIRFAKVVVGK